MPVILSSDVRKQYIDFFEKKEHRFIRSSPVFPIDDPTLLFTNAGMNQFKPIFLDKEKPRSSRAVNSQKCIRVSGKHNDLEEVGVDSYHHTFFEMLGNWSFGDYYKKEAISWAWELLTDVWKLDKKRLWVTIYEDDNEAGEIWLRKTDINPDRVLKFGKKENFWEMGDSGPCGPCTEIHYYTGNAIDDQKSEGVNRLDQYREIWNLVFIQYNRQKDGTLIDLPQKHVDTGAGLERITAILNGFESNYDTDLFQPIIKHVVELSDKDYGFKQGIPHRVIADHLRMLSFSIADGIMPSNEGRGYVLRRVIRRAARFGRILGFDEPFIYKLIPTLAEIMGDSFPEIIDKKSHIEKVIHSEESSFNNTLDRGLEKFEKISNKLKGIKVISGDDAFKLYDTFGFPLDLTQLLARENGLKVDSEGFAKNMELQKKRARAAGKFEIKQESNLWYDVLSENSSSFTGYDEIESSVKIVKYRKNGDCTEIILNKTPFYPESGGQIGDSGILISENFKFKVLDTQNHGVDIIHIGKITDGKIIENEKISAQINSLRREAIRRNHTATHLLHQALKQVLGDHIQQAGSLVAEDRLRFDLTHYEKITQEKLIEIESVVNKVILENVVIDTNIMDYEVARNDGAVALFGEKYEDEVRVVNISNFSKELCGGTHVKRTGDIGLFKIISESSLSAGVRRMEAVTGNKSLRWVQEQSNLLQSISSCIGSSEKQALEAVEKLVAENNKIKNILKSDKKQTQKNLVNELIDKAEIMGEYSFIYKYISNIQDLKDFGGHLLDKLTAKTVFLIGSDYDDKPIIVCGVTSDLTEYIHAGKIVSESGKKMKGGGGGKSHLASAGGKNSSLLNEAMELGKKLIEGILLNL